MRVSCAGTHGLFSFRTAHPHPRMTIGVIGRATTVMTLNNINRGELKKINRKGGERDVQLGGIFPCADNEDEELFGELSSVLKPVDV